MSIEEIRGICLKFKGVKEDIKWENHLCFTIGDKMFLITNPDEVPVGASFKVSEDEFDNLICIEGFVPAPYLARYKWIRLDDINRLNKTQWEGILNKAYQLIFDKLSKKTKKQILNSNSI